MTSIVNEKMNCLFIVLKRPIFASLCNYSGLPVRTVYPEYFAFIGTRLQNMYHLVKCMYFFVRGFKSGIPEFLTSGPNITKLFFSRP